MYESPITRFCLGMGCALAWVNMTRYLSYHKSTKLIVLTVRSSFPDVIKIVGAVMPITLAFVTFGVVFFSPVSPKFATLDNGFVTLFSVAMGDEMIPTFSDLRDGGPFISRAYLYLFVCFAVFLGLNLTISMVTYWFESARAELEKPQAAELVAEMARTRVAIGDSEFSTTYDESMFALLLNNERDQGAAGKFSRAGSESDVSEPDAALDAQNVAFDAKKGGGMEEVRALIEASNKQQQALLDSVAKLLEKRQ